jgi:shikimate kinase
LFSELRFSPVPFFDMAKRTPKQEQPNLFLVGFMGTGKSSLGRLLADRWRRPLYDTDVMIEQHVKMSVAAFFEKHGEAAFRALERECVEKWLPASGASVSCGGGLSVPEGMGALLKSHGEVVCLFASAETIYRRICHSTHRPLLQCADPLERIRELVALREPAYMKVGTGVFTDGRNFSELAAIIERIYYRATGNSPAPRHLTQRT